MADTPLSDDAESEIEIDDEADDEEASTHVEFDIATYPSDLTAIIYLT